MQFPAVGQVQVPVMQGRHAKRTPGASLVRSEGIHTEKKTLKLLTSSWCVSVSTEQEQDTGVCSALCPGGTQDSVIRSRRTRASFHVTKRVRDVTLNGGKSALAAAIRSARRRHGYRSAVRRRWRRGGHPLGLLPT